METVLEATLDGAHVLVEVAGLAAVQGQQVLAAAAAAGVVIVAVLAVLVARPGAHLAPALAIPAAGIGAAVAWSLAAVRDVELVTVIGGLAAQLRRGDEIALLGGAAAGAAAVLGGVALLTARRRRFAAAVVGAAVVVMVAGVVPVQRLIVARDVVVAPLRAAWPLPSLRFAGQGKDEPPLEVHVGRTRQEAPTFIGQLGALSEPATKAMWSTWRLDGSTVPLRATKPGPDEATARVVAGPVAVSVPVRFVGVRDEGPPGLSLRPGHRQSFAEVMGREGTVDSVARKLQQRRRGEKLPAAAAVLSVLDEREEAGLHLWRMQVSRGGVHDVFDAVARDGVLYRRVPAGGHEVLVKRAEAGAAGECEAPVLGYDRCRCGDDGIERCVLTEGNTLGALGRMSLALLTLGLSEVTGACADCGRRQEKGLVRLPER